jgi:hypothetical protein
MNQEWLRSPSLAASNNLTDRRSVFKRLIFGKYPVQISVEALPILTGVIIGYPQSLKKIAGKYLFFGLFFGFTQFLKQTAN